MGSESSFLAACIQFDVHRDDVEHNIEQAESCLREAAEQGARLAVLPEMWATSFLPEVNEGHLRKSALADAKMVELASELGLMVVAGGLVEEAGSLFNRAQVIDRGEVLGEYRKIHLFSPNAEHRTHQPGAEPLILDTELGRLGVVICYDIRFPELIRYYFYKGVELLAVPAQWPEARASHWRVLLKARAIENETFVLGCNRTGHEHSLKNEEEMLVFPGDSRIIDPMGEVLAGGSGEEGSLVAEIQPRKVRTMRRILPVGRDRKPRLYRDLWTELWSEQDAPAPGSR